MQQQECLSSFTSPLPSTLSFHANGCAAASAGPLSGAEEHSISERRMGRMEGGEGGVRDECRRRMDCGAKRASCNPARPHHLHASRFLSTRLRRHVILTFSVSPLSLSYSQHLHDHRRCLCEPSHLCDSYSNTDASNAPPRYARVHAHAKAVTSLILPEQHDTHQYP